MNRRTAGHLDRIEALHAGFDRFAEAAAGHLADAGQPLACAKGCAFCCYSLVSLLPAEAFRLAAHIDTLPDAAALKARITAHAARHGRKDGMARLRGHVACPCLCPETLLCRVHPTRPLTCRGMNSVDAGVCRDVFERRDPETPLPTSVAMHRRVQQIYDREAGTLAAESRSFAAVELSQALALIWAEPDSEARWLAREDVFAGCRTADIAAEPPPDFG